MEGWQYIYVISAADNPYAQHLAVALVSLLVNLAPGWKAHFFVADGELTPENRTRLQRSVERHGGEIEFLQVSKDAFDDLYIAAGRHITQASYYRLVMPELLRDRAVDRAVYLDCDVIVRDDISRLYETPMDGEPIGAVEDLGGGFRCADLNMPEGSPYFNSGVLLIDLPTWRRASVSEQVFRFLRAYRHRLHYHDQDGLNAVLHGQWRHLDPKWNVQRNMLGRIQAPEEKAVRFRQAAKRPSIVHFTGSSKPWQYDNAHPYKREYFRYLSLTEWKHYKPQAGPRLVLKRLARRLLPDALLKSLHKLILR